MNAYEVARHWYLHELRRVRASFRIGNSSALTTTKERKALQRDLVKLRAFSSSNHGKGKL